MNKMHAVSLFTEFGRGQGKEGKNTHTYVGERNINKVFYDN